jgi:hypothetical protein
MINAIIFSKDRACQLDLFLRSIVANVPKYKNLSWTVIYLATTPEYRKGYELLMQRPSRAGVVFCDEAKKGFEVSTLEALRLNLPYHVFFVDDDCFKTEWNPTDGQLEHLKRKQELLTISLRMDPSYRFCYTQGKPAEPPILDKEGCWNWINLPGDWGYPMSLDGHIFRTQDIVPLIQSIHFKNPNSFEAILASKPLLNSPQMFCYPKAKLINLPINKVQTVNKNHAGTVHPISVEELNAKFLDGFQLNLDSVMNASGFLAPHHELPLGFQKT